MVDEDPLSDPLILDIERGSAYHQIEQDPIPNQPSVEPKPSPHLRKQLQVHSEEQVESQANRLCMQSSNQELRNKVEGPYAPIPNRMNIEDLLPEPQS